MKKALLTLLLTGSVLPACYHATIDTGLPPSAEVVGDKWASAWILGLVPPDVLDAGAECESGVARVETQHSFTNQLVGFLTLGIYTPIEVLATCARASGDHQDLPVVESEAEWNDAIRSGEPFLMKF